MSLWERDADLMARAVARHDAIISREVSKVGGQLVRAKGGLMQGSASTSSKKVTLLSHR